MSADNNRSLASADEETKERAARKGEEARAQDPESLAEAGRKGGEAVIEKYGPDHMSEIGEKVVSPLMVAEEGMAKARALLACQKKSREK